MELFIRYPVPSDLLSFSGRDDAKESERLSAVKDHVAGMLAMIREAQEAEIAEKQQERDYQHMEILSYDGATTQVILVCSIS